MKKVLIKKTAMMLFLSAAAITGCSSQSAGPDQATSVKKEADGSQKEAAGYQKVSPETVKERMDAGDDITVLDVRTAQEYEEKHIPGAVLIPNEDIGSSGPLELLPDLEQEIYIYCRSGNRSAQAAKKMLEAGYNKVYDFGGINDWTYETESGAFEPSDSKNAVSDAGNSDESAAENSLLGTFESMTLEGETVNQDIFSKSSLTMLNIWGTFCGPCIQEMPDLGELSDEYEGRMQIIGLIGDVAAPDDETAKEIIDITGADYLHILNSPDLQNGYMRQVQVVPTTVFLDKDGKQIGSVYPGAKSKDAWKKIIDEKLEQVED